MVPTIYDGDAHLEGFAKALKGSYFSSPRYKGKDLNGDHSIDLFDRNQLIGDFGKNVDPIPRNSDINGDGHVDISDYNELMKVFS